MSDMWRGFWWCGARRWWETLRNRGVAAASSRSWTRVLVVVAILLFGGCNRAPDVPPYQMLIDALRGEDADALTVLIPGLRPEDFLSPDEQQAMQNRECNGVTYGTNVSGSAAMFRRGEVHYKTIGFAPRGTPTPGVRTEYSRQIQEAIFKDFEAFAGKREVFCQTARRKNVHGVSERRCTAIEVRLPTWFKYDPPSPTPRVVVREFTSYGAPIGGDYSGYRSRTATQDLPWLHEARNADRDGHFQQGDLLFKVEVDDSGKATVTRGKMSPPGREPADLAVPPSAVSGSSPNAPADLPPVPSAPPSAANTNAAPSRPALSPAAAEPKPSRALPENVDASSKAEKDGNEERLRTWTDSTGQHHFQGELIDFREGNVHLKGRDGKAITVPIDKLSPADQEFVRSPQPN